MKEETQKCWRAPSPLVCGQNPANVLKTGHIRLNPMFFLLLQFLLLFGAALGCPLLYRYRCGVARIPLRLLCHSSAAAPSSNGSHEYNRKHASAQHSYPPPSPHVIWNKLGWRKLVTERTCKRAKIKRALRIKRFICAAQIFFPRSLKYHKKGIFLL